MICLRLGRSSHCWLPGSIQKRGWPHRPCCSSLLSCFRVCTHTCAHTHTHTASCGESPPHPLHQGLTPTHLSTTFSGGHSQAPPHLHYSLILALHINSIYHNFNYIYVIGNYFISVSCHKTSRSVKARTTSILLSNNYAMPTTLPGT